MFSIDLLKGQGIPIKSKPGGAAILAFTIAVPIIAIIVMAGCYIEDRIVLSRQKLNLNEIEAKIEALTDGVAYHENTVQQMNTINSCLEEVRDVVAQQIQWSPVIKVIAQNIPGSLLLELLNIKSDTIRKKCPKRSDPTKEVIVPMARKKLQIGLCCKLDDDNGDQVVQEFIRTLGSAYELKRATNIKLLSQLPDEERNVKRYEIECVFDPF